MSPQEITKCNELPVNISEKQRLCSGIAGGILIALAVLDFNKSSLRKAIRLTAGTLLVMRSISGYCPVTAWKNAAAGKMHDEPPVSGV